jgi:hypothetical protein
MTTENSAEIPPENEQDFDAVHHDGKVYECHICGYKPRPSAANPKEALRKHIHRYHKHAETEAAVDAIVEDILESSSREGECAKLYEDIEILKVKFPEIPYSPDVHPDSSFERLSRAKNTMVRLVSDKSGADAAFALMLVGCRGAESATSYLGLADVSGLSADMAEHRQDFLEILREMVDTGVISSTQLSPEVRLGMLLVQVGVHRMEMNRCSKNCDGGSASQGSK